MPDVHRLSGPGCGPGLQMALDFLGAHAVPGLETYDGGRFTRVITASHGPALVTVWATSGVSCSVRADPRDVDEVLAAVRRLLDLDTPAAAVDAGLAADPVLAPLVAARPGLRSPGSVDGFETLVRTIVGQQNSVLSARTVTGRIVAGFGEPAFGSWRQFPSATALAAADPAALPIPRARGRSVVAVAAAVASGALRFDEDPATVRAALLARPGVGPWTADYVAMRVLGDHDVLLASDLVVRRVAADLGIDLADGRPAWSPYRSYATHHLWAHRYADTWSGAAPAP